MSDRAASGAGAAGATGATSPAPRRRGSATLALTAVAALLVVTALRAWVLLPVRVESASMEPTLSAGDVLLVSRSAPRVSELERGDLVVFAEPRHGHRTIKRVVGLPGESVVVLDGVLHVDGRAVEEAWVVPGSVDGYYSRTFVVPPRHVLVLGDNRGNSVDSRDYGAVPAEALRGSVLASLWPLSGTGSTG